MRHRPGLLSPPARSSASTPHQRQQQARPSTPPASTRQQQQPELRESNVRIGYHPGSPSSAKQLIAAANNAAAASEASYIHEMQSKFRRPPGSFSNDEHQQQQKQGHHQEQDQQPASWQLSHEEAERQRQRDQEERRFSRALQIDRDTAAPPHSYLQQSVKSARMDPPDSRVQQRRQDEYAEQYQQQFSHVSAARAAPQRDYHNLSKNIPTSSFSSAAASAAAAAKSMTITSPTKQIVQQAPAATAERYELENRWLNQQMQLYSQRARSAEAELSDLRSRCTCGAARSGGGFLTNRHLLETSRSAVDNHLFSPLGNTSRAQDAAVMSLFPSRPTPAVTRESYMGEQKPQQQQQKPQEQQYAPSQHALLSSAANQTGSGVGGASRALLASPRVGAGGSTPGQANPSRALLASFGGNAKNLPASATVSFSTGLSQQYRDPEPTALTPRTGVAHHQASAASSRTGTSTSAGGFRLKLVGGTVVMVREDGTMAVPLKQR